MEKRAIIVAKDEKIQGYIWDRIKNHFGREIDGVIPDAYKAIPLIKGEDGEVIVVYEKTLTSFPSSRYGIEERRILERILKTSNNNCDSRAIPHIIFDDDNRGFFEPILKSAGPKMREKIKYWDTESIIHEEIDLGLPDFNL